MSNNNDHSDYIQVLSDAFAPAVSVEDTTHWYSTDEVFDAIKKLDPSSAIKKDDVYQALLDSGYSYGLRPGTFGLDFRWMLKLK